MNVARNYREHREHNPLALLAALVCLGVCGTGADTAKQSKPKEQSSVGQDSGTRLPAVSLDGNYFSRDGDRFIPVGANWVPARAASRNGPR